MPSISALWRHWLHTTYICTLWQNSHISDVYINVPLSQQAGWIITEDGSYSIDWEDPDKLKLIRKNIDYLLRGCSCKKGCVSNRCGCNNLPQASICMTGSMINEAESTDDSTDSSSNSDSDLEIETITDNFIAIEDIL